ncbi:hypothetical protein [Streptomyces sp. NPDC059256]|uniref:hypothetical protein n=1 Tax=Streptomyces sp. NPDC059256 TaxID=3346794 RepID=UPI0036C7BEDF
MRQVKVEFEDSKTESRAVFEGTVEEGGPGKYVIKGKTTATLPTDFPHNRKMIILEHGGTSSPFRDVAREVTSTDEQTIELNIDGERGDYDSVDLRLSMNLGGKYHVTGEKTTVHLSGRPQDIETRYTPEHHSAAFKGQVWADGPEHYVIKGMASGQLSHESGVITEYVAFEHGSASGSWHGQTFAFDGTRLGAREVLVRGERKKGEGVMIRVGVTNGSFNTFTYGEATTIDTLPLTS